MLLLLRTRIGGKNRGGDRSKTGYDKRSVVNRAFSAVSSIEWRGAERGLPN